MWQNGIRTIKMSKTIWWWKIEFKKGGKTYIANQRYSKLVSNYIRINEYEITIQQGEIENISNFLALLTDRNKKEFEAKGFDYSKFEDQHIKIKNENS